MKELNIDGKLYSQVNNSFIYVSTNSRTHCQSLVDCGDNAGVSGEDITVINITPYRHVNIQGINNHDITSVTVFTVGALAHLQYRPVIIIMNHYVYHIKGNTIHYSFHIEWYKNDVHDKTTKVNVSEKRIITHEGYILPLQFSQGL